MELQDFIKRLKDKAIDHREYFHYTTVDKYLKMQTPVKLPDGEAHRMFWLTPATATNDGMERKYGDHAYLGCFTYSPYENVGMWFMYGKQRADAIRIGFDKEHFDKWRKSNIMDDGKKRKAKLYGVSYGVNGEPKYRKIPADQIEDVCFYDVAYVCSREDVEHHRWPKSVEWRRDYHEVRSDDTEVVSKKGSLLYSNDFTERTCSKLPFCFKKKGWSNEREVRLVVSLKPETAQWEHIAIPFDEPIEGIESCAKKNIVLSPWCNNYSVLSTVAAKSDFAGELLAERNLIEVVKPERLPVYVRINTWDEFYRVAAWFMSKADTECNQWVFRGERDKNRELTTSFERRQSGIPLRDTTHLKKWEEYNNHVNNLVRRKESSIIRYFKTMMSWHYMGEEWLPYVMAMQHYGGPTRLLDFSTSLFTAFFFAYEHDERKGERTIWAINLALIMKWAEENCKVFPSAKSSGVCNFTSVAESVFKQVTTDVEGTFFGMPGVIPIISANNPRMLAQKGLFLMPLKNACFLENLSTVLPCATFAQKAFYSNVPVVSVDAFVEDENTSGTGLVRLEFADSLRQTAKNVFIQANIARANLFPDTREDDQMFNRIRSELDMILKKGLY